MKLTLPRIFIYSAGLLLLITGGAKLYSTAGNAHILQLPDPILIMSFRHIFWIVGILELIVAAICFSNISIGLQGGLVACLATSFLVYRLGLVLIGYHKPSCSCLGNLTDALHISPQTADTTMKIILGYMLVGSYATLCWLWRQKQKVPSAAASSEISASLI